MITVHNVMTDQRLSFDEHTDPEYALLYAQCVEDNKLASWFFEKVRSDRIDDVKSRFKIYRGKLTISSGDWYYRKTI